MIQRVTDNFRRVKRLAPDWPLTVSDEVFYLVANHDGEDVGVMAFHPCDQDGLLMHVQLGEKCRGAKAAKAYRAAFDWVFTHTDNEMIYGRIPAETRHARIMARNVGGQFDGIDCDGMKCYSVCKYDEVA